MPLSTPLHVWSFALLGLLVWTLPHAHAQAQPPATTTSLFAARDEQAFLQAQKRFSSHPGDTQAACDLGRATYDWAELATNSDQRAAIARAGIAACRQLIERDPKSAPGHYYLGMDYGELAAAEAPSLQAYKLIREIEHEFKTANDLDEKFDFGGPPRCLGLLYRDAPGWPISIGNNRKAREFLDRAAELAPDFPENQMNLVESAILWHEAPDAEKAWQKLNALWPAARTNLSGLAWEQSWDDWTKRYAAARANFEKTFKQTLAPANPPAPSGPPKPAK